MDLDDFFKMLSPELKDGAGNMRGAVVKMNYDHGKVEIECKCKGLVTLAYVVGILIASLSKSMDNEQREIFKHAVKISTDVEEARQ